MQLVGFIIRMFSDVLNECPSINGRDKTSSPLTMGKITVVYIVRL